MIVSRFAFAPILEVGAHQHQPGQLPLRPRRRLQRAGVETGDLLEDLLQPPHQLERPLRAALLLVRVEVLEPRQHHDPLVHPRVVLHRAAPERIEAGVDAEVAGGQRGEVAHELRLCQLGETWRLGSAQLLGHLGRRQVVARQGRGTPPGLRLLVDEVHQARTSASTCARRSMSAGLRFSVTAIRRTSSMPS